MGRNILVPVDASVHSQRAFDFYIDHLMQSDDKILLVHIFQSSHSAFTKHKVVALDEVQKLVEKEVIEMDSVLSKFETCCINKKLGYEMIRRAGPIGQGICELATSNNASCIVMGSRGLNGVRRTFLGSVSDYVLHHAHIPVTVVPPTPTK